MNNFKIAFAGLADSHYYHHIAKYCLPSWSKLPGDKFIVHDGNDINLPFINVVQWNTVKTPNTNFEKSCQRSKAHNFWRKMQSQVWTIRNLKDYDYIMLLDTDIEVINFNHSYFDNLLIQLKDSNLIWATGESQKNNLDAGHIIFDMHHPRVNELVDYYENIWESGDIFKLERWYDGHAVESMFSAYPSYKIKNTDHGTGFHSYELGTVHYGSKLPKAIRAAWQGDSAELIERMKIDKFTLADELSIDKAVKR